LNLQIYDNSDFDRGAPRWKEALWILVRCLFFQNSFPWPSELRVWLLRAIDAKIGNGVIVRANVNISFPWRLTVDNHVWIGEDVDILSLAQVTIESNVCISQRAYLCTGSHDFRREDFKLKVAPITVAARRARVDSRFVEVMLFPLEGRAFKARPRNLCSRHGCRYSQL
jgi:putative colanic acid biosynthesis acetyltransferase WcaF